MIDPLGSLESVRRFKSLIASTQQGNRDSEFILRGLIIGLMMSISTELLLTIAETIVEHQELFLTETSKRQLNELQ